MAVIAPEYERSDALADIIQFPTHVTSPETFLDERTPPWTPEDIELAGKCAVCLVQRLKRPGQVKCAAEALPAEGPTRRGTSMARITCAHIVHVQKGKMPIHQIAR